MNYNVRDTLKKIIDQYGIDIVEEPNRLKGLLLDYIGEHKREIFILINAAEIEIPLELIKYKNNRIRSLSTTLNKYSRKLSKNFAFDDKAALWAVETWAFALGIELGKTTAEKDEKKSAKKPFLITVVLILVLIVFLSIWNNTNRIDYQLVKFELNKLGYNIADDNGEWNSEAQEIWLQFKREFMKEPANSSINKKMVQELVSMDKKVEYTIANIMLVEKALKGEGYSIDIDKEWTEDTEQALQSWQKREGLAVTGRINLLTMKKLKKANFPPVMKQIEDKIITEGDEIRIKLLVDDTDDDILEYQIKNLPEGARFSKDKKEFYWKTKKGDKGIYEIVFDVLDQKSKVSQDITITVKELKTGSFSVLVKDFNGQVSNALIVLKNDRVEKKQYLDYYNVIDSNIGVKNINFKLDNLPTGNYSFAVYKLGYLPFEKEIKINENRVTDLGEIKLSTRKRFTRADGYYFYIFNTKIEPYNNLDIRKAVSLGINKNKLELGMEKAQRIITPLTYGYSEEADINEYNPMKVNHLLASNDINELKIDIAFPEHQVHQIIASNIEGSLESFEAIRQVKINSISEGEGIFQISKDNYCLWASNGIIKNPDPMDLLLSLISNNDIKLSKENIDLLEKAKNNLDDEKIALNYIQEVEKNILNERLVIPLFYLPTKKVIY